MRWNRRARAESESAGLSWQRPKGFHYFVLPTGLGNRAGVLPGVDYLGRNAYVVAPPSQHPSGVRYRWIIPGGLAPAPSWLLELVRPQRELSVAGEDLPIDPSRATAYGHAALRRELDRLSQAENGTRNDHLNRSASLLVNWSLPKRWTNSRQLPD